MKRHKLHVAIVHHFVSRQLYFIVWEVFNSVASYLDINDFVANKRLEKNADLKWKIFKIKSIETNVFVQLWTIKVVGGGGGASKKS